MGNVQADWLVRLSDDMLNADIACAPVNSRSAARQRSFIRLKVFDAYITVYVCWYLRIMRF